MIRKTKILFVDDEPAYRRSFSSKLRRHDENAYEVETAENGVEALEKLATFTADIVFTDFLMPRMDGMTLLTEIRERHPGIFVVMLTGVDETRQVVAAMKAGAYDYILKPFDFPMIVNAIDKLVAHRSILDRGEEMRRSGGRQPAFENIIGQDQKMFELYEKINQVAQSNAAVLITGESGTGKELIAAAIHSKSTRSDRPLVQVNCASLTETLINSELFGHEKGAFTGAVARKRGFFEKADGGTLFLDEFGDIPMATQVALLRVLELGTFQRVGGTETIRVDVRLICATNRNLLQAVRDKLFREDLYYRINVVALEAPSLRERKSDVPLLANFFFQKYCTETGKPFHSIPKAVLNHLKEYAWPGNVRELANAMEHAAVFRRGQELSLADLPPEVRQPSAAPDFDLRLTTASLAKAEEALIRMVLEECQWNLKQAAQAMDIARGTLYSKMEKYGIEKPS